MDNPNTGVKIRRHKSLILAPSSTCPSINSINNSNSRTPAGTTFLYNHIPAAKSNPYVGWFRHSPPTAWNRNQGIPSLAPHQQLKEKLLHEVKVPLSTKIAWSLNRERAYKKSPYVGWFHYPHDSSPVKRFNSSCHRRLLSQCHLELEKELWALLRSIPVPNQEGLLNLTDLLSGHLYGGTRDSRDISQHPPLQLHEAYRKKLHDRRSTSATTTIFQRLLWWLLFPLEDEAAMMCSAASSHSSKKEDEEEDLGEDCSYDGHSYVSSLDQESVSRDPPTPPLEFSVSSQAQAYYAHQLSKELDASVSHLLDAATGYGDYVDGDGGVEDRLDYSITQMDIVRMTRNASRHLDVESILKLPTVVYSAKEKQQNKASPSATQEGRNVRAQCSGRQQPEPTLIHNHLPEEGSWMIVQQGLATLDESDDISNPDVSFAAYHHQPLIDLGGPPVGGEKNPRQEEQDVCVICLEHFVEGDRLRILPCRHSFHMGCIDRWLSGSHSFDDCFTSGCPTCKKRPDEYEEPSPLTAENTTTPAIVPQTGGVNTRDGSVPSWALARIGSALARESRHF